MTAPTRRQIDQAIADVMDDASYDLTDAEGGAAMRDLEGKIDALYAALAAAERRAELGEELYAGLKAWYEQYPDVEILAGWNILSNLLNDYEYPDPAAPLAPGGAS